MIDSRPHLLGLLAGLFLAAGLVLAAMVVTRAWLKIAESQTIIVTGSARRNVEADLVVWRGAFTAEAASLLEAQRKLKTDQATVEAFVRAKGGTNFFFTPIGIQELEATIKGEGGMTRQQTVGYRLTQTVQLESTNVAAITQLDRDSTVLVENGVIFVPIPPQYIYTKAGEAKVEMLAEATRDAHARAEQIAAQGGRRIAQLRSAHMGVFQVNPLHSSSTSAEGNNDTTSLEKTVMAVVTTSFSMQ